MKPPKKIKLFSGTHSILWLWVGATVAALSLVAFELWEHQPILGGRPPVLVAAEISLAVLSLVFLLFIGHRRHVERQLRLAFPASQAATQPVEGKKGRRRVLVVQENTIFGAGLRSLLGKQTSLDVRGLTTNDKTNIINEIHRYQPDVIILEELDPLGDALSLNDLFDYAANLRIVGVSTESDQVRVYDRNQFTVTRLSEFAHIVTGEGFNGESFDLKLSNLPPASTP